MNKQQERHGVMDRFYRALAPEVAQSLSETQRCGIEQALRVMSNGKSHAINVNSAFGLGNWRCYLVVLVGRIVAARSERVVCAFSSRCC